MSEPATPDGLHRKREVRSYADDAAEDARLAPPGREEHDPYAEEDRREEGLFPPGLLPPSAEETPFQRQDPEASLSPFHRFSHQTVRSPDGRLTRLYWVRAGLGPILEPLIRAHTLAGDANAALLTVTQGVHLDPRPSKQYTGTLAPLLPEVEGGKVSDLIAVTAGEEVLLEVDDFLATILNDVPQIEIEGKIVEITFDDDLETGSNLFVSEVEAHYRENADGTSTLLGKGNVADTPFRSFESPLDPSSFLSGGLVGSLVLSTIQDNTRYRAILRAIQASSHADVLSAPKIAVLNGHIAVIDTGSRTPVLTPTLNSVGQLQQVAVKYEDTGIKLYVTPYLLMDDMIQIDVVAEVSYVSGYIESGAAGILNPIIYTRNASTVINIRDGQTFAIGGLIATDEIELVTKIPVLGDIPVLGYLFKSTNVTERQSQVIFFITPRLVHGPAPMFVPGA